MKKAKMQFTTDRRVFLKGLALAGGAAAITAVSATGLTDSRTNAPAEADTNEKPVSKGYHETQHIRDYYRVLRS